MFFQHTINSFEVLFQQKLKNSLEVRFVFRAQPDKQSGLMAPKGGIIVLCFALVPLCLFLSTTLWWTQWKSFQGMSSVSKSVTKARNQSQSSSLLFQRSSWAAATTLRRGAEEQGSQNGVFLTSQFDNNSTEQIMLTKPLKARTKMANSSTLSNSNETWSNSQRSSDDSKNTKPSQNDVTPVTSLKVPQAPWTDNSYNNSHLDHFGDLTPNLPKTGTRNVTIFHRWKSPNGIDIVPLWDYIHSLHVKQPPIDHFGPVPGYINSNRNFRISIKAYRQRSGTIGMRFDFVGPFFQETMQNFYHNLSNRETLFPSLSFALQEGGLPLIFNLADFVGCLNKKYNCTTMLDGVMNSTLVDLPMLTMSSSPTCDFAFPIPSYTTLKLAKQSADDWDEAFQKNDLDYPWHTKIRKAVWRGVLSDRGRWNTSILDIPRVHINVMSKNHSELLDCAVACESFSP